MRARRVLAAAISTLALLTTACSGDGAEQAQRSAQRTDRSTLPMAKGVDPRHPDRSVPLTLVVAPVDVPRRAQAGVRIRAVFQARPNSSCQLELFDEEGHRWDRLAPAVADGMGRVSWSWVTEDDDAGRVATAYVVCSGGQRGEAEIAIV